MAKLSNSPFRLSGKIGNMVACSGSERGTYLRRLSSTEKPPSLAQLAVRLKMKLASEILTPFRSLIKDCWKKKSYRRLSPFSQAMSHILNQAFEGTYPDLTLDYARVQLSYGKLQMAIEPSCMMEGGQLKLSWAYPERVYGSSFDEAIVAVYNEVHKAAIIFRNGIRRSDSYTELKIPATLVQGGLHVWLLFQSEDGKSASQSSYLGRF